MLKPKLRIGTRRNALAKSCADMALVTLRQAHSNLELQLFFISALSEIPENSELTELEQALLDGEIDVAIEDLSKCNPILDDQFNLAAVLCRADPRYAFVTLDHRELQQMNAYTKIAAVDISACAQLKQMRADLEIIYSEEALETLLRKMQSGSYEGIVIPYADIILLQQLESAGQVFGINEIIPKPGQGAIGLVVRADDAISYTLASAVNHESSRLAVIAELELSRNMGQVIHSAYAKVNGDEARIVGMITNSDDQAIRRKGIAGHSEDSIALGAKLADQLKAA